MSHSKKSKFISLFSSGSSDDLLTSDLDPLNPEVLLEEIAEEILSYLPLKDLLNGMTVSRLWNLTIGKSAAFRKHSTIKLHSWNKEIPTSNTGSLQNTEVLSISDFKLDTKKLQFVKGKNWRDVTFSVAQISSQRQMADFFKNILTVKDLKILNTNIGKLHKPTPIVIFPKLEHLAMSDVTLDLFEMLIVTHSALKSLSMRFVICDVSSPQTVGEALTKFLALNPQLTHLELNYVVVNDVFKQSFPGNEKLQLKSLSVGLDSTAKDVGSNISEFIKSQAKSLEHLKLILHQKFIRREAHHWGYWDDWHDRVGGANQADNRVGGANQADDFKSSEDINIVYNSWNSTVNLKSLEIRFLQSSSELEFDQALMRSLKANVSLKSLFIKFMNVSAPQSVIMNLLKLSPNLETLYVTELSPAVVRFAAMNLRVLRNLKCFAFKGECHVEYNNLKTSEADSNKLIVISDRCTYG